MKTGVDEMGLDLMYASSARSIDLLGEKNVQVSPFEANKEEIEDWRTAQISSRGGQFSV